MMILFKLYDSNSYGIIFFSRFSAAYCNKHFSNFHRNDRWRIDMWRLLGPVRIGFKICIIESNYLYLADNVDQ